MAGRQGATVTPGYLATADGRVFEGRSYGASGIATGEVVFNTAMTGYQEIATDPSYAGQIVVMTAPHIGNYGVADDDAQASRVHCTGFVTRSNSRMHSNWRAGGRFDAWLVENGVVAITDVDTRALTRHVRDHGAMPAAVGAGIDPSEVAAAAAAAPSMAGRDLVTEVTTTEAYTVPADGDRRGRVVAYDFGMKRDIVRQLTQRGYDVIVVPAGTSGDDALALQPDGVFLSNGPGDPEPLRDPVAAVRSLLGRVPVFGICLGHQILGLALGARTFKLPFGHHGGNHPVRYLADGSIAITSQNHGFAVDLWSLTTAVEPMDRTGLPVAGWLPDHVDSRFGTVRPTHQNLNDGTVEGLECLDLPAFSVQYHPEAAPGPHDAVGLFDRFMTLMPSGA